jgi:hypothetical protein
MSFIPATAFQRPEPHARETKMPIRSTHLRIKAE